MEHKKFKITLPILKTRVEVYKDESGEEQEKRFIGGVASSTEEDLVGDEMTPNAIKSMAESLKKNVIDLNAEHDKSWRQYIGEVSKLDVSEDNELVFEGELSDMSAANDLWLALTKYKKQLGISIGGWVRKYDIIKKGELIARRYEDIELDHLAVTSSPAHPKTWVSAIAKSLNKSTDTLINKEEQVMDEEVKPLEVDETLDNGAEQVAEETTPEAAQPEAEVAEEAAPAAKPEAEEAEEAKPEVEAEAEEPEVAKSKSKKKEDEEAAEEGNEDSNEDEESEEEEEEEDGKKKKTEKTLSTGRSVMGAATELAWAISHLEGQGKDTSALSSALEQLKSVAAAELSEPEVVKSEQPTDATEVEEEDVDVSKALEALAEGIEKKLSEKFATEIQSLQETINKLSDQPAERAMLSLEKGLGNVDAAGVDTTDALRKRMDAQIESLKKSSQSDPEVFAKIQAIRREYSQSYGIN